MQISAKGRDLDKWCTLNYFKQQENGGCNVF